MSLPIFFLALALFVAPLKAATPEESLFSPILVGLVLIAAAWEISRRMREREPHTTFAPRVLLTAFIAWAVGSLVYQWQVVNHGAPAFLEPMLQTTGYWLAGFALMTQFGTLLAARGTTYFCTGALVLSAGIASYYGLQDYVLHLLAHQASWREFATSSPDFFAGFLVMTIPVTLALFIASPGRTGFVGPLFYGMMLLPQIFVLPTTGSRFALVSLAVGLLVFIIAAFMARRGGLVLTPASRNRAIALVVIALLGSAVVAKPILHRLSASVSADQAHSGQFRVWTWRGTTQMIKANPLFGTGPGTYKYSYQKYAIVGFTRLAHNAYLQTAAEIGIAGVAFLLLGSLLIVDTGRRSLLKRDFAAEQVEQTYAPETAKGKRKKPREMVLFAEDKTPPPTYLIFAGVDEKLLQCGLIAGFVAGLVQNVIDSDWYITFDGLTLWFLGGMILALASKSLPPPAAAPTLFRQALSMATIGIATVLGIALIVWGSAEATATIANDAVSRSGNTSAAYTSFRSATQLNQLKGSYFSTLGYKLDPSVDPAASEPDLRRAIELEPDGVNYRRYAKFLLGHDRIGDALTALRAGIVVDPNNVELWNLAAEAHLTQNDGGGARSAYDAVAAIETSLVGTIRAVTEIVDINYVTADLYLADDALAHHNLSDAQDYYRRVEATLRAYADEGGTTNMMRMPTVGGHYDANVDAKQRDAYNHAATALVGLARATHSGKADEIEKQRTATLARFDGIIATTSASSGPK